MGKFCSECSHALNVHSNGCTVYQCKCRLTFREARQAPAETPEESARKLRKRILGLVDDTMGSLLYYDRKEDDEMPPGAIEEAIAQGVVTVDEIVAVVRKAFGERS